ncbi:hypothetical protein, partial [Microvirga aerophila]|uniref:hypothetical protein n=1 Tax=Microvirga aerophila TaxID=670291 RepID=UPI001AEEFFBC
MCRSVRIRRRRLSRLAVGQGRIQGQKLKFEARTLRLERHLRTLPHLWAALDQEPGSTCVA